MARTPPRNAAVVATALAAAAHLALDLVTSRFPWTTPPYLLLDHARGPFHDLLLIDRTAILAGASIASSAVNGIVSAIFGVAVEDRPRRLVLLAAILSGLWVLSGVLLAFVYLSVPGAILAGSLAAGIPRAFVVAWLVDRVLPRPVVAT
jgi:hypothetical protein